MEASRSLQLIIDIKCVSFVIISFIDLALRACWLKQELYIFLCHENSSLFRLGTFVFFVDLQERSYFFVLPQLLFMLKFDVVWTVNSLTWVNYGGFAHFLHNSVEWWSLQHQWLILSVFNSSSWEIWARSRQKSIYFHHTEISLFHSSSWPWEFGSQFLYLSWLSPPLGSSTIVSLWFSDPLTWVTCLKSRGQVTLLSAAH